MEVFHARPLSYNPALLRRISIPDSRVCRARRLGGGRDIEALSVRIGRLIGILLCTATWVGCGTTKWTDTARTATEQLLITDSIDRAVSRLDFRALAGKKVFVDETPIKGITDSAYLLSAVRQHLLASGAILKDKKDDGDYILELRAGAIGTDRHDVLFGIPATQLPPIATLGTVSSIPEIPFVKKTDQRAVAKISLFAYNRQTGRPVWQSGAVPEESRAKAVWVFGAGPFQRGTLQNGTTFAGDRIPLIDPLVAADSPRATVSVADEARYVETKEPTPADTKGDAKGDAKTDAKGAVAGAGATPGKEPADKTPSPAPAGAAPPGGPGAPEGRQQAGSPSYSAPNATLGPAPAGMPLGSGPVPPTDPSRDRSQDPFQGPNRLSTPWPIDNNVAPAGAIVPLPDGQTGSGVRSLPGIWSSDLPPSSDVPLGDSWVGRRR